jgi:toxic protein SymE
MKAKTVRRVKLHSKYHPRGGYWNNSRNGRSLPWLNVSGVWLEEAGFNIGDAVQIIIEQNTLIIKNCSANGDKADQTAA